MTTSYSDTPSGMPTRNAEGHQTWNPSVGIYHTPAKNERESYGGIIAALVDQTAKAGGTIKAYPENFAGIIAAIKDLSIRAELPNVDIGEFPEGGQIIINGDGNPEWIVTDPPKEGTLWFDTRQGRLFVWIDNDWYQTNGGDGIPILTDDGSPPSLQVAVPGQLWYDKQSNDLYIFAGDYQAADGSINQDGDGVLVWKLIADLDGDEIVTTATLPLAGSQAKSANSTNYNVLPNIDFAGETLQVQKDYNEWIYASLLALDNAADDISPVAIQENQPNDPRPGDLWYDTESLELSIWYEDDDSGQWVPTSVAYTYDEDIASIQSALSTETTLREQAIESLRAKIDEIDFADSAIVTELEQEIASVNTRIDRLPSYDLSRYQLITNHNSDISGVRSRLVVLENSLSDLSTYALQSDIDASAANLTNLINEKASITALSDVEAQIPDVSNFVTQQAIDTSIENITNEYLPRTGGILTGSFVVQKTDYSLPGFDFSTDAAHSKDAFKLVANSPTQTEFSTFGTTDNYWEYAWNFSSEEDFCWVYNDTNKVFSITKEGPACSTLYLGDFDANNANGRYIHNKIDVKERLSVYQTAFEDIRQGVSNATDFDSLKTNILSALANV